MHVLEKNSFAVEGTVQPADEAARAQQYQGVGRLSDF